MKNLFNCNARPNFSDVTNGTEGPHFETYEEAIDYGSFIVKQGNWRHFSVEEKWYTEDEAGLILTNSNKVLQESNFYEDRLAKETDVLVNGEANQEKELITEPRKPDPYYIRSEALHAATATVNGSILRIGTVTEKTVVRYAKEIEDYLNGKEEDN